MSKEYFISPSAIVDETASIAGGVHIGARATIEAGVSLGPNVRIGTGANISRGARIEDGTFIGRYVKIGRYALLKPDAIVCPNRVKSVSSAGRTLEDDVVVGHGVRLHDEVELGDSAIIPNQRTIASIGNFGTKNRVVTIYGYEEGPRYSIGCQVGVDFDTVCRRVANGTDTSLESASTYQNYLGVFQNIGDIVQEAYLAAQDEVAILREQQGWLRA